MFSSHLWSSAQSTLCAVFATRAAVIPSRNHHSSLCLLPIITAISSYVSNKTSLSISSAFRTSFVNTPLSHCRSCTVNHVFNLTVDLLTTQIVSVSIKIVPEHTLWTRPLPLWVVEDAAPVEPCSSVCENFASIP
jgi:hypothetical protein